MRIREEPLRRVTEAIDAMIGYAKGSPALDPERHRSAERRAEGIGIDPTTWSEIVEAGARQQTADARKALEKAVSLDADNGSAEDALKALR